MFQLNVFLVIKEALQMHYTFEIWQGWTYEI